jgi:hypothetical protein
MHFMWPTFYFVLMCAIRFYVVTRNIRNSNSNWTQISLKFIKEFWKLLRNFWPSFILAMGRIPSVTQAFSFPFHWPAKPQPIFPLPPCSTSVQPAQLCLYLMLQPGLTRWSTGLAGWVTPCQLASVPFLCRRHTAPCPTNWPTCTKCHGHLGLVPSHADLRKESEGNKSGFYPQS